MKKTSLIILLLLLSLCMQAQKMTVESMTLAANDISASKYERKDLNGQPCALVKVLLASPGAKFEGNMIGDVEYKTGEYWVYMSKGSRELRIKHPKAQPIQVIFSNYGVTKVESKQTYTLSVLLPQTSASVQTQKLTINYTPTNAMVLVDSKPYQGNGSIEAVLPVGTHNYIIAATGYDTAEGSIKLSSSSPRTITENLNKIVEANDASENQQGQEMTARQRKEQEKEQAKAQKTRERELAKAPKTQEHDQATVEILNNVDQDVLGAQFRVITDSQKEQLGIKYGLQIIKLNVGKLEEAGIPQGFIILRVNDEPINTLNDLQKIVKETSASKEKVLYIQGVFPTGKKAYFAVALQD